MGEFTIQIAETPFAVQCAFGSTREYFKEYLTEDVPRFFVEATAGDRANEQRLLDEEADREGLRHRVFTEPFLERAVIQRKIGAQLLAQDVVLLHGSTVAVDDRAYLFTARCGVGKSTHTRLWRQRMEHAVMVNDDRAFLRISSSGVMAFGSPWSGKHGLDTNISVPLAGICILERGAENKIVPISAREAMPELLDQVFLPEEKYSSRCMELAELLTEKVSLWRMACTKDPEAAQITYKAMSGAQGSG